MNKTKSAIAVVVLSLLSLPAWAQSAAAAAVAVKPVTNPAELEARYPALDEIEIPEVPSYTLPNGMQLYLLPDDTLPIITGRALIRTGNLFDPPDKIGLSGVTGSVLRIGGTKSRSGDEIDQELENMAASVEAGIGETSGSANFWTLKENLGRVLEIFADVLMNPGFRQDKIDFTKQQIRSGIARRNDDAHGIAAREFTNLIYGKDNPYGWQLEYEHIDNIDRSDVVAFYERYFFPANVSLAIYGDFSPEEMKAAIEKAFAGWTAKQPPVPEFPGVKAGEDGKVYFVDKTDVNQSNIQIGHLAGTLRDADYAALEVMNSILGGGFHSRLFQKVRSDLGLAYHASSSWGARYDQPGIFQITIGTKSESTVGAIEAALKQVDLIRTEPVSPNELKTAIDGVLNSFVFNFDTRSKTLRRLVNYRYWDYPEDFILQYRNAIRDVTAADVLRVAKQHLHPDKMKVVVVGKVGDFEKPLDSLGRPVEKLDISIPEPKGEQVEQDETSLARGREILAKAQQAAGGADKLAAVKDLTKSYSFKSKSGLNAEQTVRIVLPDTMLQESVLPFGKLVAAVGPEGGWMRAPQGLMPMPPQQLEQSKGELFRLRESLLLSDRMPNRTVNFVEQADFNGRTAAVVEVSEQNGPSVRLWIDEASGELIKQTYQSSAITGSPAQVEQIFSDYRDADGLRAPFKVTILANGEEFAQVEVSEIHYNTGLDKAAMMQPPQ
ncbi:MAG: pitrilysin family protein [Bryobacterales bacterium]